MKKLLFLIPAALLVLGAVSCSKEYMEEQEAKKEAAREEKVSNYWSVVGKLVSAEDRTDDYAGKTFEPVIGIEDPSDPQTRIVSTNDLESARERFANLIGVEVSKIGSSYTYKDSEVGTLVYTEGGGNSLATVEVNIKEIPHLSKIRYATPEQKGENGKFDGAAYYRFGDVISIQAKDGRTEYWMCVRPAFGKEGKENTHWVTVSPVGSANMLNYSAKKSSNKREYNIQDDLKYDSEHLQNFAELLFAICFPDEWHKNVTDIPKIKMFHDFSKDLIRYHNEAFWQNVQDVWKRMHVPEKFFGDFRTVLWLQEKLGDSSKGLYLLYGDSSWNTWFYNGPTVAQVRYSNTKGGVNANMHTVTWSKVQHDVINKKDPSQDLDYNILVESTMARPYLVKPGFFGDEEPRFIVRYAEGCELSSTGKYGDNDVRSPIPGATDFYRYYRDAYPVTDLANGDKYPEVSVPLSESGDAVDRKDVKAGYLIGKNGKFYATAQACTSQTTPAALVMYVGNAGDVESGTEYAGLAMSLTDLPGYTGAFFYNGDEDDATEDLDNCKNTYISVYNFTETAVKNQLDGLAVTQTMAAGCSDRHVHQWAADCATFKGITSKPADFSQWFIPSVGQWRKALFLMGLETDSSQAKAKYVVVDDMKNKLYQLTGVSNVMAFDDTIYLSTTGYNKKSKLIVMKTQSGQFLPGTQGMEQYRGSNVRPRPFIAFK